MLAFYSVGVRKPPHSSCHIQLSEFTESSDVRGAAKKSLLLSSPHCTATPELRFPHLLNPPLTLHNHSSPTPMLSPTLLLFTIIMKIIVNGESLSTVLKVFVKFINQNINVFAQHLRFAVRLLATWSTTELHSRHSVTQQHKWLVQKHDETWEDCWDKLDLLTKNKEEQQIQVFSLNCSPFLFNILCKFYWYLC